MYYGLALTDSDRASFASIAAQRATRALPELLIVDDDEFSRSLFEHSIGKEYTVRAAHNAQQGLAMYLAHAPDIVWLDINMPLINGHQLAELIHRFDPGAWIVMLTGCEVGEEGGQATRNGARGFITKPYSKARIREMIARYIAAR